jgi:hypothetical protein
MREVQASRPFDHQPAHHAGGGVGQVHHDGRCQHHHREILLPVQLDECVVDERSVPADNEAHAKGPYDVGYDVLPELGAQSEGKDADREERLAYEQNRLPAVSVPYQSGRDLYPDHGGPESRVDDRDEEEVV